MSARKLESYTCEEADDGCQALKGLTDVAEVKVCGSLVWQMLILARKMSPGSGYEWEEEEEEEETGQKVSRVGRDSDVEGLLRQWSKTRTIAAMCE